MNIYTHARVARTHTHILFVFESYALWVRLISITVGFIDTAICRTYRGTDVNDMVLEMFSIVLKKQGSSNYPL